ncbi:MAG: ABC transporter ATP-binding protein/permease [Alphaproteobacteria bacterium]|nr:ABC transporter ATP-binding protein/permease [Alphaproteobacteria bacterium]
MRFSAKTAKDKHKIILPPVEKAPAHTENILKWCLYFLSPYKWTITAFFTFRLIRYTWFSLFPIVIGYIIDSFESGAVQADPGYYKALIVGYMAIFLLFLIQLVFKAEVRVFEKAIRAMTLYSINHLNSLSLNWHEQQGSGGKLQRVMTGRKGFQELTRHVRWDLFPFLGNIAAILVSIFLADIPTFYLLLYILFAGSYVFVSWYFSRPYWKRFNEFNEKFEYLLSGVYEFVSAVRTVKSFHLRKHIARRAEDLEMEGQKSIMKAFSTNLMRWTMSNMVGVFWLFIFVWVGFHHVLDGKMTSGMYASTFFLGIYIWASCEVIGAVLEKVYEHGNGLYRLTQTLCITPKRLDIEPLQKLSPDWKAINLDHVTYTYDTKNGHGIHDINFTVKRGDKIAFVGNSGAGKSTLVKLLMKQMNPDQGQIHIDGTDLKHITTGEWLSQIGFVPQDVELFNLSIRDNILIDRTDYPNEKLQDVLDQAALSEFVSTLPEGLDTIIGERGIKLSGGQRQRLGIARALCREAPIIIFDEATSSLDSISESKIQTAMENSFQGRTVFLIAHRLSTVRYVDTIYVLDEGRVIEQGSFEKLTTQNGHFAKLWNLQSN